MLEQHILDHMIYLPISEITTPKQGRTCHVNRWWVIHPEKGAAFYQTVKAPQCNDVEVGAIEWAAKFPAGHEARLIPVAFI